MWTDSSHVRSILYVVKSVDYSKVACSISRYLPCCVLRFHGKDPTIGRLQPSTFFHLQFGCNEIFTIKRHTGLPWKPRTRGIFLRKVGNPFRIPCLVFEPFVICKRTSCIIIINFNLLSYLTGWRINHIF